MDPQQSLFKNQQFLLGLFGGVAVIAVFGMFIMGIALVSGGDFGSSNLGKASDYKAPAPVAGADDASNGGPIDTKIVAGDHVKGAKDAKVQIIEWSDFQCPFCESFTQTIKQLEKDYPNDLQVVYRHFPLDSIHPQARLAAEASECAAEQNEAKFWEFHDAVYAGQGQLTQGETFLKSIAKNIGLNEGNFAKCLSEKKYADLVEQQYQAGLAAGVQGTPGSFLNGQSLGGAVPYEDLKAQIGALLQK